MYKNKILGSYGEKTAVKFLEDEGYTILATNYRCRFGEIDIIAADGDTVSFIEVKTRSSNIFGEPGEAVNYPKQLKIVKTALHYISNKNLTNYMSRFDIVEIFVDADNKANKIALIKDAFDYSGKLGY